MKTTQEKIAVMQAHSEGKKIESRSNSVSEWLENTSPVWNWYNNDYRVKPEPKVPREIYLNDYGALDRYAVHKTKEKAVECARGRGETILFREVIDEEK